MRTWFRANYSGVFAAYLAGLTLSAVAGVTYVVSLPDCDDVASLTQAERDSCGGD
jgi:hypothetical protein